MGRYSVKQYILYNPQGEEVGRLNLNVELSPHAFLMVDDSTDEPVELQILRP